MAGINAMRKKFRTLNFNLAIGDALEETKGEILEYQKAQMQHGLASDGTKIGKYKNKSYAVKKYNLNPKAGAWNVDLKLYGEFYRGMVIKFFQRSFFIISVDQKYEKLTDKYGERIWGLSEEYKKDYSKVYLEAAINRNIQKQLNGKL